MRYQLRYVRDVSGRYLDRVPSDDSIRWAERLQTRATPTRAG